MVKNLLNDNAGADDVTKKVKTLGDRMGRSRQRLAVNNDPGKTTQEIQKRIVDQLDDLIELAQKQQQQRRQGPRPAQARRPQRPAQPGQGEGPQQVAKGQGQGQKNKNHQESGQSPAGDSSLADGGDPQVDVSRTIKELNKEWGNLSPRKRQAVMEGAGEKSFVKYRQVHRGLLPRAGQEGVRAVGRGKDRPTKDTKEHEEKTGKTEIPVSSLSLIPLHFVPLRVLRGQFSLWI